MHPIPGSSRPTGGAGVGLAEHVRESLPVLVEPAPQPARGRGWIFSPEVIDFRIIRVEEKLSVAILKQVDLHDDDHAWPLRISSRRAGWGSRCARGCSILSPFYRMKVVLARASPAIMRPQASVTERENTIIVALCIPQDRFFEHWLIPWAA